MKNIMFFIVLLFINNLTHAKKKPTFADYVKETKLIIGLNEYPECADEEVKAIIDSANAALKFAVYNYWDFTEVVDCMPLSEAKEKAKKEKIYSVANINLGFVNRKTYDFKGIYTTEGDMFQIYYPNKGNFITYLPYHEKCIGKAPVVFSTIQLQKSFDHMLKGENFTFAESGPLIIEKTLLIPQEYLSPEISKSDIQLSYPYDFDICDLEKVKNAILEKDPKYAIISFIAHPIIYDAKSFGDYEYRMYVSGTKDGFRYEEDLGTKFKLSVAGVRITKKPSIAERELKILGEIPLGK